MAGRDVANFMSQQTGQLCLTVHTRQNASSEIDIASRHSESVHDGYVKNFKMIIQVRSMRGLTQALTNVIEISDQLRILNKAILLNDPDVCSATKINLVRFAQEHEFLFTAYGIDRTRRNPKKKANQAKSQDNYSHASL